MVNMKPTVRELRQSMAGGNDPAPADEVLALASRLGVSGEVTDTDDGLGPGLMIGSPQSADGALLVSSLMDPFWNLQRSDVFLNRDRRISLHDDRQQDASVVSLRL